MTWAEFVEKVETQLRDKGLSRDVPVSWIAWDRTAFGGPVPDVYVNDADGEPAGIGIGED